MNTCSVVDPPERCRIPKKDLSGKRYGRLTVMQFAGRDRHRHLLWECQCDCGSKRFVPQWNL